MFRLAIWLTLLALIAWVAPWGGMAQTVQWQQPNVSVKNQYVEAQLNSRGQFTVGTLQGDPAAPADDNEKLIYGHGQDHYTSFTSARIVANGRARDVRLLQDNDRPPQIDGDTATTPWTFGDITIEQTLSPASNPFTDRPDTFKIATTVRNRGSSAAQVGVRVMLDTMIGDNDNAPFFIPGTGNLAEEREYTGASIPSYWKAFEAADYSPASLKGQGILTGFGATPPDRFLVANWPSIKSSIWDYQVTPGMPAGDSAVAIYWQPKDLAPGASTTYVTYYGLAGAGGGQAWIDAPVNVTSQEPGLEATLWVSNKSDGDFVGGEATLALPPGLRLGPNETARKPMPRIPASGGAQSVTWRLIAGGNIDTEYPYSATVTFREGSGPLSADARVNYRYIVPAVVATPPVTPTVVPVPIVPPPPGAGAPLWPLLLIPLFGIPLLWLLLRRRPPPAPPAAPPPASRPRPGQPFTLDQPSRRLPPTGSDVTHGRKKPPKPGE